MEGGLAATAGRKRRGFKKGGLAYCEITAQGLVNSAVLPSRVHVFLNRLCRRAAWGEGGWSFG